VASGIAFNKRGKKMTRVVTVLFLLALAAPAAAEFWQWTDDGGTVNFTEDPGSIPKKHRKKAIRVGDADESPVPAAAEPAFRNEAEKKETSPAGKAVAPSDSAKGDATQSAPAGKGQGPKKEATFGGKSAAAWQAEFSTMNQEINGVKRVLAEKRNKVFGDASGIGRQEYLALQKEVTDLEKKYAEVYERKQELVKGADAAGVPDDLRW
jgi:uncharacterized protein YukE